MRFVKPLKGFRFWKTIGMLFCSAAIVTGSLYSDNKACALEEPVLPPTMMIAAAPAPTPDNTNLKTSETKKAKISKKETKAPVVKQTPSEAKVKAENSEDTAAANVSKPASKKIEIVKTPEPEPKDSEKLALPVIPAEIIQKPSVDIDDEDDEDADDDDFEVATAKPVEEPLAKAEKIEIVEPVKEVKSEENEKPVVKVESKPIAKAEIKPTEKKQEEVKPAVKANVKPVVKAEPKPVVKAENKPAVKAEPKPVVKAESKPAVKPAPSKVRRAAKKVVDDSVIPQEWDWFSTPLVWAEDANGKMVLVADKTAPKIQIGNAKVVEPLPVVEESKAVKIAEELPLIASLKPAEPDYIEIAPLAAEENDNVVALEEAPAPVEVIEAEDVNANAFAHPVIEVNSVEEKTEYKPFEAAAEKMARIRRLRESEAEARGEAFAKADRSATAVRVSNFISELIDRSEASQKKIEEEPQTEIVPMAPPVKRIKAEKKPVKSMEKAQIEAENSKDDTRLAKAENNENMTFEPYIGIFGSGASRRIDNAKWKTAWVR